MVKIKNQTKAAASGSEQQAQRLGLFGASGCGKTTKARELTRNLNRIIFFEPLADDLRRLALENGYNVVYGLDNLFAYIRKHFCAGFKIAYYPTAGDEEKELSRISDFLMLIQAGFGVLHNAQITLAVDELDLSFPTGCSLKNPRNGFKNLCCRGRHTGINIIGISQRMHLIDNVFRANCSATYIFRHCEPADIDLAIKILGREYKNAIKNLCNFQYFYKAGSVIFYHG